MRIIKSSSGSLDQFKDAVEDRIDELNSCDVSEGAEINASYYDVPDQPLEPPEPEEPYEVDEIEEVVELNLENVIIKVDEDGSWEYETFGWEKDPHESDGDWYLSDYSSVRFRYSDDVVEDTYDVIEPYIPGYAGKYKISCDIDLVYTVSDLYEYRTYYDWNDYDAELDYDRMYVELNRGDSKVTHFNCVEVKGEAE